MTTRIERSSRRGSNLIEFTLIGVPMLLLLVSTIEIARGMWTYTTLSHTLRDATRYVVVHGQNCADYPNRCALQIQDIAQKLRYSGVGLDPDALADIQFISSTRTETCATLTACLSNATYWPTLAPCAAPPCAASDFGATRNFDLEIRAKYQFVSAMMFFWPGAKAQKLGTFWLAASSKERIQF